MSESEALAREYDDFCVVQKAVEDRRGRGDVPQ